MNSSYVRDFEASLADHDASHTRTTTEELDAALANVEQESVVGTPLPFKQALDDHITLDFAPRQLFEVRTGVTPVELGARNYTTAIIQSNDAGNKPVSPFPPRLITVLQSSDLVSGILETIDWLSDEIAAGRDTTVFTTGHAWAGNMGALGQGIHPSERSSRTHLGGIIA